jgi:4-aminobutyrate aminotransferase-like enzyme
MNAGFDVKTETEKILELLRRYESPNVTFIDAEAGWPIVWERAKGVHVWDAEGRKYLDLTAAFGVAAAGHANPKVAGAARKQMGKLLHAMGDVHPHRAKAELARALSRITFERWSRLNGRARQEPVLTGKTIFANSGFEAVEAALKTATVAGGKPGVIAFLGGYHGLGYGALNVTHREHFRARFETQLRSFGHFVAYPKTADELFQIEQSIERLFRERAIGAILAEPIQARGGINIPPPEFLPMLRRLCDAHGALLILDEIYTGFGRTGKWFACEQSGTIPDVVCLGKALTGGFPLSACVGRAEVVDAAWPPSSGEAIHTSTFLGHPVGCAMALAQMEEIQRENLVVQSARLGRHLLRLLKRVAGNCKLVASVRGAGLLAGIELRLPDGSPATAASLKVITAMLHRGFILLPEGEHSNVISLTPPLTISEGQLNETAHALQEELARVERSQAGPGNE